MMSAGKAFVNTRYLVQGRGLIRCHKANQGQSSSKQPWSRPLEPGVLGTVSTDIPSSSLSGLQHSPSLCVVLHLLSILIEGF